METKTPTTYTALVNGQTLTVTAPDLLAAARKAAAKILGGPCVAWIENARAGVATVTAVLKADRAKRHAPTLTLRVKVASPVVNPAPRADRIAAGLRILAAYGVGVRLPKGYAGPVECRTFHPMADFVTSRSSSLILDRAELGRYLRLGWISKGPRAGYSLSVTPRTGGSRAL